MTGDAATPLDDIVRRNVATLRAKANLTQQGLAEEMLHRGIGWTRETVGLVETTQRRLSFTEAVAVAASLDIPVARLTATSTTMVAVGEGEWTAAYLSAAVAGTAGDVFPPESYANVRRPSRAEDPWLSATERSVEPDPLAGAGAPPGAPPTAPPAAVPAAAAPPPATDPEPVVWPPAAGARPNGFDRGGREGGGREGGGGREVPAAREAAEESRPPGDRVERRMRQRVTPSDVDDTARRLWSRNLETERERRVRDRQSLTGDSEQSVRSAVARDLDRELEHELRRQRGEEGEPGQGGAAPGAPVPPQLTSDWSHRPSVPVPPVTSDEVTWEATRLNIVLANKGYGDSDVTRWWHGTRHQELGDLTVAEAWQAGHYTAVSRLVQALPDKLVALGDV